MLRQHKQMRTETIENCHDGSGKLLCHHVMQSNDSEVGILFMHDDTLEPGSTIGEHVHTDNEEVYFVVEGNGTMILDGERLPIGPGDVSLVRRGHSHGIINSDESPMRLVVVCVE